MFNRSEIMKAAWDNRRRFNWTMSVALRSAWKLAKANAASRRLFAIIDNPQTETHRRIADLYGTRRTLGYVFDRTSELRAAEAEITAEINQLLLAA